jgi:hypothetical protein
MNKTVFKKLKCGYSMYINKYGIVFYKTTNRIIIAYALDVNTVHIAMDDLKNGRIRSNNIDKIDIYKFRKLYYSGNFRTF